MRNDPVGKYESHTVDTDIIPVRTDEFKKLAAYADDNLNPDSPEFRKVVVILRVAAQRLEQLHIKK